MKASFAQQAAQRPAPSTGSRQAEQSVGSAASTASRKVARKAPAKRPKRPDEISPLVLVTSPDMPERYMPAARR
jgi:hypothetical protein